MYLPLHMGALLVHFPSLQLMVDAPISLYFSLHVKSTDLACLKSSPLLLPLLGTPGSGHGAKGILYFEY